MRYIVGVDIGGTNIVVGTVSEDGSAIHGIRTSPTHAEQGAKGVLPRINELVEDSIQATVREAGIERGAIVGVGVGSPGPLDRARGVVLLTPNLGWRDLPLRDLVSEAAKLPATLDNDANCAIYGEWWVGAAKGARYVVGLTIGTGIGGGIVIDGRIYHGTSDIAGEIGHTTIDSTGRLCKCGNYGCIEAYASGPAIAARAVEGVQAGVETRLPEFVAGDLTRITAQTVYEAARHEDEFALEIV